MRRSYTQQTNEQVNVYNYNNNYYNSFIIYYRAA